MARFDLTDRGTRVIVDLEDFVTLIDRLGDLPASSGPEVLLENHAQQFLATIQRNTREVHP